MCSRFLLSAFSMLFVVGTQSASGGEQTVLTRFIELRQIPHIGGGDADIHTKNGRFTDVSVKTHNLAIAPGGRSVSLTVTYSVIERHNNHTHLSWSGEVVLEAPIGYRILKAGAGRKNVSLQKSYGGADFLWHDESAQVRGTFFAELEVKFDGQGDDDKGNARMRAVIAVPVTVEKQ